MSLFPQGSITTEAALRDLSSAKAKVRAQAASALGGADDELRDDAISALITALDDPDVDVRASAAMSLGSLGDARSARALVLCLDDGAMTVRQCAAIALGRIGSAESFDELADRLAKGPPDVRFQAATSLVEIDPVKAAPHLRRALDDEDGEVVGAAALALGSIDDGESIELIARKLDHPARRTRFDLAYALADLGDGRGMDILGEMTGDRELAWDAICALEACGEGAADHLAQAVAKPVTVEHRLRAAAALIAVSPDHAQAESARAALLGTLKSFRLRRRALALELLGQVGGSWAVAPIRALEGTYGGRRLAAEIDDALHNLAERGMN